MVRQQQPYFICENKAIKGSRRDHSEPHFGEVLLPGSAARATAYLCLQKNEMVIAQK